LRLPVIRGIRSGWYQGKANVASSTADEFTLQGNQLQSEAQALDEATPSIVRGAARAAPFVGVAINFGFSAYGQWQQDSGNHVDEATKITDTITTGAVTAGLSYGGGAAGVALCSATGVGVIVAAGCGAIGGYLGGKAAQYVAPYVDEGVNVVRKEATTAGEWVGHEASSGYDWAKKHLCFWC
jgi:hypothetical protein